MQAGQTGRAPLEVDVKTIGFVVGISTVGCGATVPGFMVGDDGTSDSGAETTTAVATTGTVPDDTSTGSEGTSSGTTIVAGSSSDEGTSTGGPKFDVGGNGTETGTSACGDDGGGGVPAFSYIWVANTCMSFETNCPHSSVSKIDTHDMVELARYKTRPDGHGNPSRTSVNLNGDVVVANRAGGVTMIRARTEDCLDPNNTSTGPDDVKDWQDGCVAWHTPMNYYSQRPIAWTQGTLNEDTCRYEGAMVWTSGTSQQGQTEVLLLDGETGVVIEVVPLDGLSPGFLGMGIYGGAVDGEGNFWGSQLGDTFGEFGSLVRVRLSDLGYDSWPSPVAGYGMTVDSVGRPWICSTQTARFDPVSELFDIGDGNAVGGSGCMEDGEGRIWIAGRSIVAVDRESMDTVASHLVPVINNNEDTGFARGISIDYEGYVWAPAHWSNRAYRLDPDNGEFEWVEGLQFPYTYSDMTGFALSNAGVPAG